MSRDGSVYVEPVRSAAPAKDIFGAMNEKGPAAGPLPLMQWDSYAYATPALSAARTRAGVIGASRMRTPVASKKAFAIAGAVGAPLDSPPPPDSEPEPVAEGMSVRDSTWSVTCGASLKRRIG